MKKKQKPFYYLGFGSPDLMFGFFTERYESRKKAVEALEWYRARYDNPWGYVYKVTEVVATVEGLSKHSKMRRLIAK